MKKAILTASIVEDLTPEGKQEANIFDFRVSPSATSGVYVVQGEGGKSDRHTALPVLHTIELTRACK